MLPSPERLIVDLTPVPPLDEGELRRWAAQVSVFVSSVIAGMTAERETVVSAIEAVGATPVWFETFGGMDDNAEDAYTARVAASDVYMCILGPRYGKPLKTGYAATHAEYDEAERRGRRISVWVTSAELDGRQRDFLDEIRVFHTTGTFTSADDLRARVERRLRDIAAEAIAPWVKIGNVIVRAIGVHDIGSHITVSARVRDPHAAASLERFRPDGGFGRGVDTQMSWLGGAGPVRVSKVEVETTSTGARTFTVVAERRSPAREALSDVAFGNRTPEDLTELGLRVALFGEPNPLGEMGFMAHVENPLASLAGVTVPQDAIEQIARLQVTEALVGTGRAEYLTSFRFGPPHRGIRRLELGWMPRRRYVNVEPEERHIAGDVTWST